MADAEHFSLDPATPVAWDQLREQAHRMLDDMFQHLQTQRERPVWQPPPATRRDAFQTPLPQAPQTLEAVYAQFQSHIQPYTVGNTHPGFMGWVHGGGTPVGMLAELLSGALNVNVGGRNQIPVEVERQITRWVAEMAGFPLDAGGLLVTGSSMANFIAILVARTRALGREIRDTGLKGHAQLVAYTSTSAHGCIARAMEMAGIGQHWLRRIPTDAQHQMDLSALSEQIATDRAAGLRPFMVVGTAGTVDTGAIDPLADLAQMAHDEGLWFHVDGAFGALAKLSPRLAPRLAGLERADSLALDFHKWGQVPYDAGFVLVREAQAQLDTFAAPAAYLHRDQAGLSAGSPWPCDLGPDLSRGFRALKVWFTLQTYGSKALGRVIEQACDLAQRFGEHIQQSEGWALMAPVSLNIVCFRFEGGGQHSDSDLDRINQALLIQLQESGAAAPSATRIDGHFVIRAAIVNHRTEWPDLMKMFDTLQSLARTNAES